MIDVTCAKACKKHYTFLKECMNSITCVKARERAFEKLQTWEQDLLLYGEYDNE